MVSDPNTRRDKALEDIARELAKTNKLLEKVERNTRPVKFTNHPYLEPTLGSDHPSGADSANGPEGETYLNTDGTNATE